MRARRQIFVPMLSLSEVDEGVAQKGEAALPRHNVRCLRSDSHGHIKDALLLWVMHCEGKEPSGWVPEGHRPGGAGGMIRTQSPAFRKDAAEFVRQSLR